MEGIDQAGKSTQAKLLQENLRSDAFNVGSISFPVYGSPSGRLIKSHLIGRTKLPFPALCMLYSLNRWEHLDSLRELRNRNEVVIATRYTPSGLAYGSAGGLSPKWLSNLDSGLPIPDVVLILDVPVKTSRTRKPYERDLHERNIKYLGKVRRKYLEFAKNNAWKVIPGTSSIQAVSELILKRVRQELE